MAYYFVSDVHAGLACSGKDTGSLRALTGWLDAVAPDAEGIFLLGDIFDFWFEYKQAVPPGFDPLLEKLAELTGRGIPIHFFPGNHDMWMLGHLSRTCGLILHRQGLYTTLYGKNIYMEHGDRRSIRNWGELLIQTVFRSKATQAAARVLVSPRQLFRLGSRWSALSRAGQTRLPVFRGEREGVVRFARRYLHRRSVDLFVFGHLHIPTSCPISPETTLYLLGEWVGTPEPVYGRLDGRGFSFEKYRA